MTGNCKYDLERRTPVVRCDLRFSVQTQPENNLDFLFIAAIQNIVAVKFLSKMILIFLIFSITGYNALPPNDMEATMTHLANVVSTINNINNVVSKQNSTDDHHGSNFACIP